MSQLTRWVKENPVPTLAIALVGFGIATNSGNLQQLHNQSATIATQRQAIRTEANQQGLVNERARRMAEIAAARIKGGCTPVVAIADPSKFASLVEGSPVVDATTNRPLPQGTCVYDQNGNTAIIDANEVVSDVAYTGDRALVQEHISKYSAATTNPSVQ